MVALSTTESEYIGLSNAGEHLAWLRTFFDEIGHPQKGPTQLFCDNQAVIILSRNPQFRARTKHIQWKYHFVRDDLVGKGEAIVRYVPTGDMVADIHTKPLMRDLHWKFVKAMGLRLHSSGSDSINHEPHSGSGGSEFPVPFRTRKDQRYFSNDRNRFQKVLTPF